MAPLLNILSFSDLHDNLRDQLARITQLKTPTVITIEDEAQVVMLSLEHYEQLREDADLAQSLKAIDQSLKEYEEGKARPVDDVIQELTSRHQTNLS